MDQTLRELAPSAGEAAVISLLAVEVEGEFAIRCGSLLTLPADAAAMGWKRWGERQPLIKPRLERDESDLGPSFRAEPFAGIGIHRTVVSSEDWPSVVEQVRTGFLKLDEVDYRLTAGAWSGSRLFAQFGASDAHQVLWEVRRPVRGVAAVVEAPDMPAADLLWVRGAMGQKPSGQRTREELVGTSTFANWPTRLLGIHWPGSDDTEPPCSFVIGRAEDRAWIADLVPDHDGDLITIALGWDATRIDPLSCSLLVRSEIDSAPLLARFSRVSDLPGDIATPPTTREARELGWSERILEVRVPRGPRGTAWGVSLIGPDGSLLDERPVVRRIESIELPLGVIGDPGPPDTTVIGDRRPSTTEAESDSAVLAAIEVDRATATQAARRRISSTGELEGYLRWRFSARAGELLLSDPYLLHGDPEDVQRVFRFLFDLRRPIRALTAKAPESGLKILREAASPSMEVRGLPNGKDTLHDRPWLVGETGVLVGASLNQFLKEESGASTAVDLPFADAAAWREKFERWWSAGKRFSTDS